ncbi:DegT/DnrJ/EryC1/StrS family aminotransferase [candidate division KSB1 bacterium]|nr:DegT/DnrJ/EryC1/StrS family aminotransferase [candidate division KSB1 bacterium]
MTIPMVDLKRQYLTMKDEIDRAIQGVIDTTAFIRSKNVNQFEEEFAAYCGATHGVACSSGTTALQLALKACGVGPGDEVITVPFTFIATTESISNVGGKPVFVDIEEESYNIDVSAIEKAITKRTKAIIPVDLYGQPADLDPIFEIADKHNIVVIEDAAQAHASEYKGRKIGGLSPLTCYSFFPGKNLGAYGDAGMVLTNSEGMAERMRMLCDHGRKGKYEYEIEGYNFRMDGMQAAILSVKLKHLDDWTGMRRRNARLYNQYLEDVGVITPVEKEFAKHVYHCYVIRTKHRERIQERLKAEGIATGVHYPIVLHLQPAYCCLGYKRGDFPVSEHCAAQVLSLPMFPELTEEEIVRISVLVKESMPDS